jgi:hypothetical protein
MRKSIINSNFIFCSSKRILKCELNSNRIYVQPAVHEASSTACSETGSVTEHRVARKMSAPGRMKRASTRVREREGKRGTRKKK